MRSTRTHRALAALAVSASLGFAGCATQQPWELPDPYAHGSSRSSVYYGSGAYGYGSGYGYRYGDPYSYYYRPGVPLRYPGYSQYYPFVPGYYCRDANRDGRCDYRRGDGDAPTPGANPPQGDVRRMLDREREARRPAFRGAPSRPAPADAAPAQRPAAAGAAPRVRGTPAPSRPQPRLEPRQRSAPATSPTPTRIEPRVEPERHPVVEDARGRRPLR